MTSKSRVPMQVSPSFETRMKKLQENIMRKHGRKESLRDLTETIVKNPTFTQLEEAILKANKINFEIKIKLDKRRGK